MGRHSRIAWCDHTFNIAWGCRPVSAGCAHCYAARLARRWGYDVFGTNKRRTLSDAYWRQPLAWNARRTRRRQRVFCGSMCDVFEDHPIVGRKRQRLWSLIRETPNLDWLILTKRPRGIIVPWPAGESWPNVWLGVSVEDRDTARLRIPWLRRVPAAIRFVSYEPALGPLESAKLTGVDWLIYGGESGPGFRPDDDSWARRARDECRRLGIPFFYKQCAGRAPESRTTVDGRAYRGFPRAMP